MGALRRMVLRPIGGGITVTSYNFIQSDAPDSIAVGLQGPLFRDTSASDITREVWARFSRPFKAPDIGVVFGHGKGVAVYGLIIADITTPAIQNNSGSGKELGINIDIRGVTVDWNPDELTWNTATGDTENFGIGFGFNTQVEDGASKSLSFSGASGIGLSSYIPVSPIYTLPIYGVRCRVTMNEADCTSTVNSITIRFK